MTRPNFIEAEAIQRAITWAEVTGGRLYIVHMSTAEGTDLVKAAQARGVDVYAETCAQYLVLDDSAFDGPDGHLFACCPQIKKKKRPGAALEGADGGRGLGRSRPTPARSAGRRRRAGRETGPRSRWDCPASRRSCRSSTPTACSAGRLTPAEFVAKCCTNPAKLMGLYPEKGVIAAGSDADLAIIDPEKRIEVDHATMETNADWSPYQGWSLAGFAETTFCRGRKIVADYRFIGESGWGRWLPRERAGSLEDRTARPRPSSGL